MDGQASDTIPQRKPLPEASAMTARQVLNWLAFGDPTDRDMTDRADLQRRWLFPPDGSDWVGLGEHPLLYALKQLSAGVTIINWRPEEDRSIRYVQRLQNILNRASEMSKEWGIPPDVMGKLLEAQLGSYRQKVQTLSNAQAVLVNALLEGRIAVYATQYQDGVPVSAGAIPVPLSYFMTEGVTVHLDGQIASIYGPAYAGARFVTAEVASAWGAPLWKTDGNLPLSSGVAGRPTSKHLILAELRARSLSGAICDVMAAEAAHLHGWLLEHHPAAPRMTIKTVTEAIRQSYRELQTQHRKLSAPD